MSLESARRIVSASNEKNGAISYEGNNSKPARILFISNLEGKGKKKYSKGITTSMLNKEIDHSSHKKKIKDFSSFKAMFDDHDDYKIPLKMDNKRNNSLGRSEILNPSSHMKKSMALEVNLAKENMELKEKLFELAEMNLRLLDENQDLRSRLSNYENINEVREPKSSSLKPFKEFLSNERRILLEEKLSSSMCIHSDLNESLKHNKLKTMKTLDERETRTLEGDREYILAQLNEFSKHQLKNFKSSAIEKNKIFEVADQNPQMIKRDEAKHLSSIVPNNKMEKPGANTMLLRGRSHENNNTGEIAFINNNNLNSSFDSKKMYDNMILNNVNEPSAIPMNGSQNFFSRPSSQNNIVIQEEYQYIPGMENKVPSRNGSRQGSRLEVSRGGNNNRG
jgi:hypothetical protein